MPSYARAGGYGALASGLGNIINMLMANRADDEARELAELRKREAQRMGAATELMEPDVVPLAQGVMDYEIDPDSLRAIANAAEPTAPITFTPPPPRTVDVPGAEPLTVQEPAPSVTPYGNVRAPEISRMLARADEQEGYNLARGRREFERGEMVNAISALRDVSPDQATALVAGAPAGVVFPRPASDRAPIRATFNDAKRTIEDLYGARNESGDIILGEYEFGITPAQAHQMALDMANGRPVPRITSIRDNPWLNQPGPSTPMTVGDIPRFDIPEPVPEPTEGPGRLTRLLRMWPGGHSPFSDAPLGAPVDDRREVSQAEFDTAVQDLGRAQAERYFKVR